MEIEQATSNFQRTPSVALSPTSDPDAKKIDASSGYQYRSNYQFKSQSNEDVAKLSQKIIYHNYRLLDAIVGCKSYALLNFSGDFQFQRLHEILELLKSEQFIKRGVFNNMRYNDAPFFHRVDIISNRGKNITDGRISEKALGHGFGKNAEEAFSKAIGEILERCLTLVYRKKDLIRSSAEDLRSKKLPALDLNLLPGFSDEQKKYNPKLRYDEKDVFYWDRAKRVSTDETVYLPAQLLYWTYVSDENEPYLSERNTNGAGGFFTKEGAILSGIYELIQRDSFLIHWFNKLTPRQIDPKTVPHDGFQELLAESERYGFKIYCLDVTVDTGVPAFAVVISDPSGVRPRFCLGAGCQADPIKALFRALQEAWSIYYWMRPKPLFSLLGKGYRPFLDKITQDERLRLWSNPEMAEHFKFLISGRKEAFAEVNFNFPKEFKSEKEELDFLTKRVESLGPGYEVYYHQAKHPFLTEIGYCSAKVVVPQFIPLYLNETNAPLGSRRIKEVLAKLGFKAADNINPWPHPFP